jgi:hypothetical protein
MSADPPRRTDTVGVIDAAWTFRRASEQLSIRRCESDGALLVVTSDGQPKSSRFASVEELERFQHDMETFMLRTGWTLAAFSPERRTPGDRRSFPREGNDRRRWWTDPHPSLQRSIAPEDASNRSEPARDLLKTI